MPFIQKRGEIIEVSAASLNPESPEEIAAREREALALRINAERDRRLGADFEFNGTMFQRDSKSLDRIAGAGTMALAAIVLGAQPGNLRWVQIVNPESEDEDFGWIASDNSVVPMDAQTTLAFGATAGGVESKLVFAAKVLREMETIPDDIAGWEGWP